MNSVVQTHYHLIQQIRDHAIALSDDASDYTPLLEMIGDAQFVLIGEATHGTEEFYRTRALLTKKLIRYYGFSAVAVEGDWPDCYRVNRYVQGDSQILDAQSAFAEFNRFPQWMWRNEAVMEFADWLREHNQKKILPQEKIGFYGLDLYSLYASIQEVIRYLEEVDPPAAQRARHYYGCFDHYYADNPQKYGYAANFGLILSCKQAVIQQLVSLQRHAQDYLQRDGYVATEKLFCAEQNAKVIINAENYYRAMFQDHVASWNVRDRHMLETVTDLSKHLTELRGEPAKIVVWAHNSHLGDARATELGERGEWNLGQLMREQFGEQNVRLIGFSTSHGTVTAASQWGGEAERKIVRPALTESYEELFHQVGIPNFYLLLRGNEALNKHLRLSRLQRAIGVLYVPQTERESHYFFSRLPEQFDAVIHLDETSALKV